MLTRAELHKRYEAGENITAILRADATQNSEEMIEVAYDLQAGSYVKALDDESVLKHKDDFGRQVASIINEITGGKADSLMEAGVGEATTLSFVLTHLQNARQAFGFDISWSRVSIARNWLTTQGHTDTTLFTASLFDIPLPENSIDVVYTCHSIEPNGGHEEAAVRELYRVASEWVVLLEPAYDLASADAQQRMRHHGYCVDLFPAIESLGYEVFKHELFPICINPLNPTGMTILRKQRKKDNVKPQLCCPVTHCTLQETEGFLFSPDHLAAYPVMSGIPCLRSENSIVASHLPKAKRPKQ